MLAGIGFTGIVPDAPLHSQSKRRFHRRFHRRKGTRRHSPHSCQAVCFGKRGTISDINVRGGKREKKLVSRLIQSG